MALTTPPFENKFIIEKRTPSSTRPSYLVRLPNHFTDDKADAHRYKTEQSAHNAMISIMTYSLNPQNYKVIML